MKAVCLALVLCLFVTAPVGADPVLLLSDAWQTALKKSDDLAVARARVARSRANQRRVLAAMLPALRVTGTYTLNEEEVKAGDKILMHKHDYGSSGEVSMTLFDARAWPVYGSASQRVKVEKDRLEDYRQELLLAVAQSYYAVLASERLVSVAGSSLKTRQKHLEAARARFTAGQAVKLDVERAKAAMHRAVRDVLEARNRAAEARDALAFSMGVTAPLQNPLKRPSPPAQPGLDNASALARAQAKRRDLKAMKGEVEIAERNRTASWLALLPRVNASGTMDMTKEGFRNPSGGIQTRVVVRLSWELYDGGMRYAQLDDDAAVIREANASLRKKGRQIEADVRNALRTIRHSRAALVAAVEERKAANSALDAARAGFRSGAVTGLEVLEAESALIEAEVAHIRSELMLDLARLTLSRVIGVLKA